MFQLSLNDRQRHPSRASSNACACRSASPTAGSCRTGSLSLPSRTPLSTQRTTRVQRRRSPESHPGRSSHPRLPFRAHRQRDQSAVTRTLKRAPSEPLLIQTEPLLAHPLKDRPAFECDRRIALAVRGGAKQIQRTPLAPLRGVTPVTGRTAAIHTHRVPPITRRYAHTDSPGLPVSPQSPPIQPTTRSPRKPRRCHAASTRSSESRRSSAPSACRCG
jgi:hypothetical protein